jgi:hypothetical protein
LVSTIKTYVKSSGTYEDVPSSQVARALYEDNGTQALNRLTIDFTQDIVSGTANPFYNREMKFDIDGTEIFGGRVEKQTGNDGNEAIYTAECWSYGGQFLSKLANEIYENVSPEFIVEDLITTYTDLTYASTVSTGVVIDRIVFRDKPLSECLQTMANLLGYFFTTDADKNMYFEEWGSVSTGLTFDVTGGSVLYKPQWQYNTNEVVTQVTIEGGLQQFNVAESFVATASQTEFSLVNQPVDSVNVTVNGVVKDPQVSEQNDGDYVVKIEDKKVVFNAGLTVSDAVVITYSYNVKIKVQAETEVFDDDGNQIVKEGKVTNKSLKTTQEARLWGDKYLSVYSIPQKSTVIPYVGFPIGAEAGRRCFVLDTEEGDAGINEEFVIESISYSYETGLSEITVGSIRQNLFDWQAEVNERLRTLAQDDTDENKLQIYRRFKATVAIGATPSGTVSTSTPNDSFILGHKTLGRFRATLNQEADCSDNLLPGTWSGTGIDGSQFTLDGFRLSYATLNGTDNKVSTGTSIPNVGTIVGFINSNTNSRDLLKLGSGSYLAMDSSGSVTSTGLTNQTITEFSSGSFTRFVAEFDEITADDVQFGYNSTYFDGDVDELMFFSGTISDTTISEIQNKTFYTQSTQWTDLKLWWSFDNPKLGNRRSGTTLVETF